MTTKTGEKLRGRKRDPEVMAKAWATRRKNARAKKRAAKKALDQPNPLGAAYRDLLKAGIVTPDGSKKRTRKAQTSRALTARLSEATTEFIKGANESLIAAIGASEADGANLTNQNPMDEQLVAEFIARCEIAKSVPNGQGRFMVMPWSQLDAVLRRLGVVL